MYKYLHWFGVGLSDFFFALVLFWFTPEPQRGGCGERVQFFFLLGCLAVPKNTLFVFFSEDKKFRPLFVCTGGTKENRSLPENS